MIKVKKKRLLLLPGSYNSPSARFRIWQFVQPLVLSGFNVSIRVITPDRKGYGKNVKSRLWKIFPYRVKSILRLISALWILKDAKRFNFIIINRDIVPELKIRFLEKYLIANDCKLIFDFDDAIHLGKRSEKLATFLPGCYFITPGNQYLADFALQYNSNVRIIPTVVDTTHYSPAVSRTPGKVRIGWSGSSSTNIYCLPILKPILELLSKELDFEFLVISNEDPKINWEGVQTKFLPWSAETEVSNLQLIDIGLMPLNDSPFERGKCGLKAIQYMALGIPALVSPVGVNGLIVTHNKDGFHCLDNSEWLKYLRLLISDRSLCSKLGTEARSKVVEFYSVEHAMNIWRSILT